MPKAGRPRVKIPTDVETQVLLRSGRRCCVCWALQRESKPVKGQIAHIDKDPSNNEPDNLAFLCMDHHDDYDRGSSQAKGLTLSEIKAYRDGLYSFRSQPESSGEAHVSPHHQVVVGRDFMIAGGDIVIKQTRGTRRAAPIIPGTVATDLRKLNHLDYLFTRYKEFKKWDCDQRGQQMRYPLIYVAYKSALKCEWRNTPLSRFNEAITFLQKRIKGTRLGRIKSREGNRLFDTFDEYPG